MRIDMQVNVRETTVNDAQAVFGFFLSQGKVREEENKLWLKRWGFLFQLNPWLAEAVHPVTPRSPDFRDEEERKVFEKVTSEESLSFRTGSNGVHHPIGWVIERENGSIGGYAGNIILPYMYGGVMYKAACITGLVVDPAYRRYSLPMLRKYFTQTGIDIFMSSTANEVSGMIFETLKIPRFPAEYYNIIYYFLISPTKVVYSFLQRRIPAFFARAFAIFIGAILVSWFYLRDAVWRDRNKAAKGWRIVEKSLEDLDETYDAFWKLIRNQKDQLILLRTREALRWHFAGAGNWSAPTLFCYYEEDRMQGYVILDKHLEKESGILRFRCVDILTSGDKKEIIKRLIVAAYTYAKREGADLLVCYFLPLSVQKILSSLAHLRRKRSGGVYLRILNPKLASADVGRKWYATCADGDSAFWSLTVPRL